MKKEYFTDNLSIETLAKFTDTMLKYEKTQKHNNKKSILLRVIPIAAAIVFVIGLINLLPMFNNADIDVDTIPDVPGASSATNPPAINTTEPIELFLPEQIEKSFFEERILGVIIDARALDKLSIYYKLSDSDNVYYLTPNTSKREKDQLLSYLYEYTDLTGNDMIQMLLNNNIPIPKNINPDYSHVRFGDDENTLLLDVEWHTYDTYMEKQTEQWTKWAEECRTYDWYINLSDEEKEEREIDWQNMIDDEYKTADQIEEQKLYYPRLINGKETQLLFSITNGHYDSNCRYIEDVVDISDHLDADGYYPYHVYPYCVMLDYFDEENGTYRMYGEQWEENGSLITAPPHVNSKREYDNLINNVLLPLYNDQLARGVLTQEYYDYMINGVVKDPVDYYIDLWFD